MDTDSYANRCVRSLFVVASEGALDLDGAKKPLTGAPECEQETVALKFHLLAAVTGSLSEPIVIAGNILPKCRRESKSSRHQRPWKRDLGVEAWLADRGVRAQCHRNTGSVMRYRRPQFLHGLRESPVCAQQDFGSLLPRLW